MRNCIDYSNKNAIGLRHPLHCLVLKAVSKTTQLIKNQKRDRVGPELGKEKRKPGIYIQFVWRGYWNSDSQFSEASAHMETNTCQNKQKRLNGRDKRGER